MKKVLLTITFFSLSIAMVMAQAPQMQWSKTYGGSESDRGWYVDLTSDGGFIILGTTESFGNGEISFYLIKTDSIGDTVWTKVYPGGYEDLCSVEQTDDNGYFIVGTTDLFGAGNNDIYLIKTDSIGDTLWTRTYGGTEMELGTDGHQTSDGGYIVVGYTQSYGPLGKSEGPNVYLIKTNAYGDSLWTKVFKDGFLHPYRVNETSDKGYIIAGETSNPIHGGGSDVYVIKTDVFGAILWTKKYGGVSFDEAWDIQETFDGGYFITGTTKSFGVSNWDYYLIKTDSMGNSTWENTYGHEAGDASRSGTQTFDGGYIITGWTCSFSGYYDAYFVRTDSNGELIWEGAYGGPSQDESQFVRQTPDRGYICVGGTRSYGEGDWDIWLIKIAPDNYNGTTADETVSEVQLYQNYPNPFSTYTTIEYHLNSPQTATITFYNQFGKQVGIIEEYQQSGLHKVVWTPEDLPNGIYYLRLMAGKQLETGKIILMR